MALKIGGLYITIDADDKNLDRAYDRAHKKTKSFGDVLTGVMQGIGQRLFDGIVRGVGMVVTKMGEAVQASSDLSEAINKVNVVFGQNAAEVLEWSKTSSTAFGQSRQQALEAVGTFGALFSAMGVTGEEAQKMSISLVELASDIASFNNISPEEALIKLRAGLVGEVEPLRTVGVQLEATAVAAKAVQLGLAGSTQAVTAQDKVMARYAIILEQTKIQQGDFARTSTGLANAQRILAAQIATASASLGDSFRPALESITNLLIGIAPQMFGYAQNITDQFAAGLAAGIRSIIPIITTIRQLFTYWFKPGSPPKILPDIDKWGAGTMQAWLDGMASVDVKAAFDTVGKAVEGVLRSFVAAGKMDETGLVGTIFGSRDAIASAVAEFKRLGSVSDTTIQRIAQKAGPAGQAIANLTKTYFDLQRASEKVKTAQDELNRTTEQYDAIINPLRDSLDQVRGQQQALANQQRLIAAQNTLANFESTAAEKQAAALEIQQIALEDQLSAAERKKAAAVDAGQEVIDTATKEEAAAKLQLDAAQATIDRQVETNNLLGEQKRLVEQLAAAQEAAASKAAADAERAANEAEQAAEKAKREAEQLAAAQLRYNLAISDTPGQIAIMEAELAKLTPGTVEYFNVLTQLEQLQQQYGKELDAAAKKAAAMGAGAIEAGGMIEGGLGAPITEVSAAAADLSKAIDEMAKTFSEPIAGEAPGELKRVADALDGLFTAIERIGIATGLLSERTAPSLQEAGGYWSTFSDAVEENTTAANAAQKKMEEESRLHLEIMASDIRLITALMNGDWSAFWEEANNNRRLNQALYESETSGSLARSRTEWAKYFSDLSKQWGQWFTDRADAIGKWVTDLTTAFRAGGSKLMTALWDGMKSKWGEVETWFSDQLSWLRSQLPFSEPKDPASPLRNLGKSGESIIGMVQGGMERAAMSIEPLASALLPSNQMMAAGATTNNNLGGFNITVNVSGGGEPNAVKGAVRDGVLDALRAGGVR